MTKFLVVLPYREDAEEVGCKQAGTTVVREVTLLAAEINQTAAPLSVRAQAQVGACA